MAGRHVTSIQLRFEVFTSTRSEERAGSWQPPAVGVETRTSMYPASHRSDSSSDQESENQIRGTRPELPVGCSPEGLVGWVSAIRARQAGRRPCGQALDGRPQNSSARVQITGTPVGVLALRVRDGKPPRRRGRWSHSDTQACREPWDKSRSRFLARWQATRHSGVTGRQAVPAPSTSRSKVTTSGSGDPLRFPYRSLNRSSGPVLLPKRKQPGDVCSTRRRSRSDWSVWKTRPAASNEAMSHHDRNSVVTTSRDITYSTFILLGFWFQIGRAHV